MQHFAGVLGQLQGVIYRDAEAFPCSLGSAIPSAHPWGAAAPFPAPGEQLCCPALPEGRIISGERMGEVISLPGGWGGDSWHTEHSRCPDPRVGDSPAQLRGHRDSSVPSLHGHRTSSATACPILREQGGDRATGSRDQFIPHSTQTSDFPGHGKSATACHNSRHK